MPRTAPLISTIRPLDNSGSRCPDCAVQGSEAPGDAFIGDPPYAPRELERIPQALPGFLPRLPAASDHRVEAHTPEPVERDQIAKGYEFERGRYVTLDDDELKALQIESSKIIDLSQFVARDEVDPVYLDAPYYVYPDGALATEAFRVIGEAMAAKGLVGLGRVTITSRERLVLVEPRDAGLLMWTLHSADEVRSAEFGKATREVDTDMLAIAETIIERRKAGFDPASFRDRYQDALRELVETGRPSRPPASRVTPPISRRSRSAAPAG